MAIQHSKIIIRYQLGKILKFQPQQIITRNTTHDYANRMCGNREYVGWGVNGSPNYADIITHPMPAIRFREATPDICALRKKEEEDWTKLSKEEIKKLYRYSFCQTFAEFQAFTGEWKLHVGVAFWLTSFAILFTYVMNVTSKNLPDSYEYSRKQAQLKRMICLEMNPITGLSSQWDYEKGDWK